MISTRTFFKTGKFRSRKQQNPPPPPPSSSSTKPTAHELTTSLYKSRNGSIDTTNTASSLWSTSIRFHSILGRKQPAQVSQQPQPIPHTTTQPSIELLPKVDSDSLSQASKESDETMREPVKLIPPFQGLPTTNQSISSGLLDDDEYRALGLRTPEIHRTNPFEDETRRAPPSLPTEDKSVTGLFEMDVPMQISRSNRPDLQVKIPANTTPSKSPRLRNAQIPGPTPPSAMSTPSSLPTGRHLKSATTATPRSVVSPLTGVEMLKPKRPFSTDSIGGVAQSGTPTMHHRSETLQHHRQERSRRPSVNKDHYEADTSSKGTSAAQPLDATTLYHSSLAPSPHKLKPSPLNSRPTMQRKGSAISVAGSININKPLPPEPPSGAVKNGTSPTPMKHIAFSAQTNAAKSPQTPSRSNSIIKQSNRALGQHDHEPLPSDNHRANSVDPARRASQSLKRSTTLRSKYTPKDLDSMDEAFQRGSNNNNNSAYQTPVQSRSRASPSQSQISLADANFLHTITENSTPRASQALQIMDEPLQISRGPMKMEPSRRPPVPQRVHHQIDLDKVGAKRQTILRTKSNTSINTVSGSDGEKNIRPMPTVSRTHSSHSVKVVQESPRKRSLTMEYPLPERRNHERGNSDQSTSERRTADRSGAENVKTNGRHLERTDIGERVSKADRVLGRTGAATVGRPVYELRSQQKEPPRTNKTPGIDSDDEEFYEIRGKADAHFEEIENRLKLLSPRDDPAATFDAFHQANVAPYHDKQNGKLDPFDTDTKPTIEDKLHLSGTLQGNPIVPTFIAELEGHRDPSPVELHGSDTQIPALTVVHEETSDNEVAELGVPSPEGPRDNPMVSKIVDQSQRHGRSATSTTMSLASGKTKSLHSGRSVRVRSLASIAASDIPDFYASSRTPESLSNRPSMVGSEYEDVITADAAERVLLHILQSLDNLEDLFAAALVSKGFYRTFKRHELYLLKHAIWKMSPAAWELREMSIPFDELEPGSKDYTSALYFRYYVQDLLTMVELKAMILESCKSFLRPETISGLTGETQRSPMIDEAFWRVWTFCRIFGCGNKREDDIVGQMDWLRGGAIANQSSDTRTLALTDELARNSVLFNPPPGFARGNGKRGLTAEELYDMIEIWTCLGVLVRGYHGKRTEARDFGVYDRCNVAVGDTTSENAMLEEWTHHLLTLAPSTVLDVTSPATPTRTQFSQARSQGYTKWSPPKKGFSRSTFLKEAVSRVYEEKMSQQRPAVYSALPSVHPSVGAEAAMAAKARIARHAAEIKKQKEDPSYRHVPISDDRPLSNYSDVLDRLEAISAATDAPPMPKLPGLAARLSRAKSRGNSAISEAMLAPRPASPTSTIQSSHTSAQNSYTTGPDNVSTADLSSAAVSTKATKSKIKHPFQRKTEDSSSDQSPSRQGLGRFSTLRGHKVFDKSKSKKNKKMASESLEDIPDIIQSQQPAIASPLASDEKFAVLPAAAPPYTPTPLAPQVRDPVDLAVERLVKMGFEEAKAKKVLAQTETGNGINFDAALTRLKKEAERRKRLERLETMG